MDAHVRLSQNSLLRRHWRNFFILLALIVDTLAIGLSGLIAYSVREYVLRLSPLTANRALIVVGYSGSILLLLALILGLYRESYHTSVARQHVTAAKAYLIAVPIIIGSFYFLEWNQLPRVFTTFFFIIIPMMYTLGRGILQRFSGKMRERGFGVHSTILFDEGTAGTHLFHRLDLFPEFGYEITAVVTFNGLMLPKDRYSTINVIHLDSMAEMKEHILANSVDRVIVPTVESHKTVVSEILTVCKETGAKLTLLSKESEELLRFSYINDVAGITLYSARRRKIDAARRIAKRAFDFVGSILAIVLFSPVIGFTALAILAEDGLPIFYRQKRALARGRKELEILKFRTMVKDAETQQANLYEKNETSGGLFMLREDPRILKVGRFLRKLSLDELPQLFNVLFGEMSLVGPRPLSIADLNNISVENTLRGYYELRANAIPGMTGLWQISGRRELSFKEMVLLDLYYIDNQSVMFDVEILLATVPVVLFGKGGY